MFINFGEPITKNNFDLEHADGKRNLAFNLKLKEQLHHLVFEIDKKDIQKQKQLLEQKPSLLKKITLFIPALIGFLIHAPLYLPIKNFTYKKTWNNDFYDSVLITLLLFIYPIYVALIVIIILAIFHNLFFLLLIIGLPFTAWCYVQLKSQLDKP